MLPYIGLKVYNPIGLKKLDILAFKNYPKTMIF